jgi:NDP-hexose-3-ketoreductase
MSAGAKPGIAVWGVGSHARRNLIPAIAGSPWLLIGLLSRTRAVVAEVAAPLGARVYADQAEMLADPAVAAVLIAGPNGVHYAQTKAVLGAGKHALVEKSFCDTYDQAAELVDMAAQRGLLAAECFSYVFHPQFGQLKAALNGSGRLASLTARFGFPFRDPSDIRYRADLAGGALLDVGAYCLSAMARLVPGPAKVAWARMDNAAGYEVDTGGQAVVELAGGVTGLCDWGFGRAYRNELEGWSDTASLLTERIFAKPVDLATTLRITHQQSNRIETVPVAQGDSFAGMLNAMAAAIADKAAREKLAAEILEQAALVRDVRRLAGR